MKLPNFFLFLISAGFSISFAEDGSENENPSNASSESAEHEMQKTNHESKTMEKTKFYQRQPEYLITPALKLTEPRQYYPQFTGEGPTGPQSGPRAQGNRRQNLYLTDETGRYSIKLESLRRDPPSNFQAALGAISAHILNQKSAQEYIPYPPNGDPYNYPAYRGHPHATEPPVIRAYERATNSNYDVQPVDFDQRDPRRIFSPGEHAAFSEQFGPAEFFNDGAFQLRRNSHPIHETRWFDQGDEGLRKPIK